MSRNPIDEQKNDNCLNVYYSKLLKECGEDNIPLFYLQFKNRLIHRYITGNMADRNRDLYDISCKIDKNLIQIYDNMIDENTINIVYDFCKKYPLIMTHSSINPNSTKIMVQKNLYTGIENRWPKFNMNFNRINLIENKYFIELFFIVK